MRKAEVFLRMSAISNIRIPAVKPVQKCMSNHVHVHRQTFVAQILSILHNARKRSCFGSLQNFESALPEGGPASSTYLQANPELIIQKVKPIIKELVMLKEVKKTGKLLQDPYLELKVQHNAQSIRSHPLTSPNFAPATKNYSDD